MERSNQAVYSHPGPRRLDRETPEVNDLVAAPLRNKDEIAQLLLRDIHFERRLGELFGGDDFRLVVEFVS